MSASIWQEKALDLLLGTEPRLRRHVTFVTVTAYFYAVCSVVVLHAESLGLTPAGHGVWMAASMAAVWVAFYALVRSGWSQRWADPTLTLPHFLAVVALDVQAYLLSGPSRSNVLLLIAQMLVFGTFRLTPRQMVGGAVCAGAMLGAAMVWVGYQGGAAELRMELITLGLTWTCLAVMALLAREATLMRRRQMQQGDRLRQALQQAHELARRDALTGVANRLSMEALLQQEHRASGEPLAVAVLDIDFFKLVNDSYGHRIGDAVLHRFAREISTALCATGLPEDAFARWGGEEFLLAMPGLDAQAAMQLLERLRSRIAAVPWQEMACGLRISFSAGLTQKRPGDSVEQLVERADRAMYAAKHAGRDRCHALAA